MLFVQETKKHRNIDIGKVMLFKIPFAVNYILVNPCHYIEYLLYIIYVIINYTINY